jgi:FKBP-type peptidyl-prolyl cis-trans isomerase (trigger factor)
MRENAARAELRRTLMDSLIECTPFDVPPGMVEQQLERELEAAAERMQGAAPEPALRAQLERWREEWRPAAERRTRERLLLEAVIAEKEITIEADEIDLHLQKAASEGGMDVARLRSALGEEQAVKLARSQLGPEKALDFLASVAKVEETTDS